MSTPRDPIADLRGGIPAKCDFCLSDTPQQELHPEEAGAWICSHCISKARKNMSTHDTAESLKAELACVHEACDEREIMRRALDRLALLERGIERADKQCCELDPWRDADSPDFRSSLLALIEELGMDP